MLRFFKKRAAIKKFLLRLPLDLKRRFGEKHFYSVEEVTRATQGNEYDKAFLAYAFAVFCSPEAFDAHFAPLKVSCTYEGLRSFVAKKYFGGATHFDVIEIIRLAKTQQERTPHDGEDCESAVGFPPGSN